MESPDGSVVKNLPAMQETPVQSLEDILEKEMTTHSSILAWRFPWMEEADGLQSMVWQRVGHTWAHTQVPHVSGIKQYLHAPNGYWASLVAQRLKLLPGMWETRLWSLGWEDPLEKEMAPHSSTLAWRIPWMEEPGGLQSMGSQRVRHDWVTFTFTFTNGYWNALKVSLIYQIVVYLAT